MFDLCKTNFYLRSNFCSRDSNEQTLLLWKKNAQGLAMYVIVLKAVLKPEKDQKSHIYALEH